MVSRIVGNFISNALRYTRQGGVLVACRQWQEKTWVEAWDTGVGIASDKTIELFEEYRQLDQNVHSSGLGNEPGIGSGLGLAIVAKSAAVLGLQIRVKSRLGHGSMFAVEVPLGQVTNLVERHGRKRNSIRIALVEDNANILDAMPVLWSAEGIK